MLPAKRLAPTLSFIRPQMRSTGLSAWPAYCGKPHRYLQQQLSLVSTISQPEQYRDANEYSDDHRYPASGRNLHADDHAFGPPR